MTSATLSLKSATTVVLVVVAETMVIVVVAGVEATIMVEFFPILNNTSGLSLPTSNLSRLGHPGAPILNSLHRNKLMLCNTFRNDFFCHSCPHGKQIKLPFYNSLSFTYIPFDIVHRCLWTSLVSNYGGHHCYVLFLNDFTDFL